MWKRYWPWWSVLLFLITYEIIVLLTHHQTLSQMVWQAQRAFPALKWIVVLIVGVLLGHFFHGRE